MKILLYETQWFAFEKVVKPEISISLENKYNQSYIYRIQF